MYKIDRTHGRHFWGVALALIVAGAAILALGLVQWILNQVYTLADNFAPSIKIIGGLIVIALGYIHLELELIRTKDK